jgi:hypothetical protein
MYPCWGTQLMSFLLLLVAVVLGLVSFVCQVFIWIAAFKDEVWKGLVCVFCCQVYTIYYALFEFDHPNRTNIILGFLVPGVVSAALMWLLRH